MYRFLILFSLIAIAGCAPSGRPSDLPKLYPCEITITQNGQPLAEAIVKLEPASEAGQKYNPASTTDENGKVELSTYGFPGVPEGKYKLVVIKIVEDDFVYNTDESGEQVIVSSKNYRLVEEEYSKAETTPHEIEVTGKGKKVPLTFDVGEPIREPI